MNITIERIDNGFLLTWHLTGSAHYVENKSAFTTYDELKVFVDGKLEYFFAK